MQRDADWNDWRAFLAVARSGSTLAAARALRVSQTTVARRIAALEEALDLALFERRPAGYALTALGEALVGRAEAVEEAALAAEAQARAAARGRSGTVRITAEEIFSSALLAPNLVPLRELYPEIRIEIDNAVGLRDLAAGEADIALRSSRRIEGAGLVGRVIGKDEWTLYCSHAYAQRHGVPATIEALRDHVIVGGGGGMLAREYGAWIEQAGLADRVTVEQGSATGLMSAVRTGLGIAALPCIVADAMPDLIRCAPPPEEDRCLWLLTHERLRHQPAVRAVIDFLYDRLIAHVRGLEQAAAA
ncbi:LysR family transcriptional regulator [Sphingomonas astaxanthinifaciens]|nr:LysR family transcriptional regulator [Sphingomonas astaxanthinifaciens]